MDSSINIFSEAAEKIDSGKAKSVRIFKGFVLMKNKKNNQKPLVIYEKEGTTYYVYPED